MSRARAFFLTKVESLVIILLYLLVVSLPNHVEAQVSLKSEAKLSLFKKQGRMSAAQKALLNANSIQLPKIDNDSIKFVSNQLAKECPSCRKSYYGVGVKTGIDVLKEGKTIELREGTIHLLTLKSESALGMQFHFSKFKVPRGATLHLYNKDKSMTLGAFSELNNNIDKKFATQLIKGNEITLEYFIPRNAKFRGDVFLERVIHSFEDVFQERSGEGFEDSGSCTIDIACPQAIGFENESKAVALISSFDINLNLASFCSGFLINSPNASQKPYLMTAAHCVVAQDEANPPAGRFYDWVFYFNYENSVCGGTGSNPIMEANSITGASIRTIGTLGRFNNAQNSTNADFALLELSNNPELFYDVYYLGWDRSATISSSVVGIHHPRGDVKKFSKDLSSPSSTNAGGLVGANSFWEVDWDYGITQPASSGSPLLNGSGLVIGQLYGGSSRCADSPPEEEGDPQLPFDSGPDWYGKISHSWNNANFGKDELDAFLDPSNTGLTSLAGYNPPDPPSEFLLITNLLQTTNEWSEGPILYPEISFPGIIGELSYQWSPASDFFNPTDGAASLYFGGERPTLPLVKDYTLTVTGPSGLVSSMTKTFYIYDCESKSEFLDVCSDRSTTLGYSANSGETYSWSPSTYLSSSSISNPTFTPLSPGVYNYVLTVTQDLCTRTESLEISAEAPPLPSTFTPSQIASWNLSNDNHDIERIVKLSDGYLVVWQHGPDTSLGDIWKYNSSWVKVWSGMSGNSTGLNRNAIEMPNGDIFVGGTYSTNGGQDNHLTAVKFDQNGNKIWSKYYAHKGPGGVVQPTSDGNLVIVGSSKHSQGFHPSLTKIDQGTGNVIWSKVYPLSSGGAYISTSAKNLAKTSDGFLITATKNLVQVLENGNKIRSRTNSEPGETHQVAHQTSDGGFILGANRYGSNYDYCVYKLNSNLSTQWKKIVGGNWHDFLRDIIETEDNGFIVGGYSDSPASRDKSQNAINFTKDYWLIKFDQFGNIAGDKRFGTDKDDFLTNIFKDSNQQYILSGWSNSTSNNWIVKIKDDDEPLPIPNPEVTEICENFNPSYNNLNNPIKNEVIILGDCPAGVLVSSGAEVSMRASEYILLKPGTTISSGSEFVAKVGSVNIHACDIGSARVAYENYVDDIDSTNMEVINEEVESGDLLKVDELSESIAIYPNPADQTINIAFNSSTAPQIVSLVDASGRLMGSFKLTQNFLTINSELYPSGMYFLVGESSKEAFEKKVIITH